MRLEQYSICSFFFYSSVKGFRAEYTATKWKIFLICSQPGTFSIQGGYHYVHSHNGYRPKVIYCTVKCTVSTGVDCAQINVF